MTPATVDVNVFVSALINPHGAPRRVIRAWQDGLFTHVTSDHIITTLEAKLADPELVRRFPFLPAAGRDLLLLLRTETTLVAVLPSAVVPITGDPEDDTVLATVRLAHADYLVTGDKGLLALGTYEGARIVSPRDFLPLLGQ